MARDLSVCPHCRTPHDGDLAVDGLAHCPVCDHRWAPTPPPGAVGSPSPVALTIPLSAPRRPPTPPRRLASGEYLPDESKSGRPPAPLTERVDGGSSSSRPAVGRDGQAPTTARPSTEKGRQPPLERRDADSDLFDRLEHDAARQRAREMTVIDPGFSAAAKAERITCPVCGHAFFPLPGESQTCPQCGASFGPGGDDLTAIGGTGGDPFIGRTIRGCLLDRKLGEGGMGAVYHARQLSLDRSVAIKLLPAELARNRGFIARFEREAKTLAAINHPNILHIYDFGEDPGLGVYFMVIEYVDGQDLGDILHERHTLAPLEVLDLVRQSLSGMDVAARKNIIHRDIKPDNLLLTRNGTWKVADFGLAKGMAADKEVTQTGVRVGTPAFMSPEQCDGVEVDVRSDIYNLGVTVFLALTGRLPYDAETPFAIMLKHKHDPVTGPRDVDPAIHPRLDRLVRRMLAKRPSERCADVRDLIDECEALMVTLAGTDSILRASRGPFRAMRDPSPRILDQGGPEVPVPMTPAIDAPPADLLLVEPASLSPGPVPVPVPTEVRASPLRAVEVPADPANPRATPSRGVPSRSSRRLDAAVLRSRGMRSRAESLAISAERHASAGRWAAAAAEWRQAAETCPDQEWAEDLRRLSRDADRRHSLRRILWRGAGAVVLAAGLLAGIRWLPPLAHGWWSERDLEAAGDLHDLRTQRSALVSVVDRHGAPWGWYGAIFPAGYPLPAGDIARERIAHIDRILDAQVRSATAARPAVTSGAAIAVVDDGQEALSLLQARLIPAVAAAAGEERNRLLRLNETIALRIAAASQAQAAVQAAQAAGRHDQALALAARYPVDHGRVPARLPAPARLVIGDGDGPVAALPRLVIDGIEITPAPGLRFCRDRDRDIVVQVTVPGYEPAAVVVQARDDDRELAVPATMTPAAAWSRRIGSPGLRQTWARLIAQGADAVLCLRGDGATVLRLADGLQTARHEPTHGVTNWIGVERGRLLIAHDGGEVVALGPDLQPQRTLHRDTRPPSAYLERELVLRPDRIARLVIDGDRPELRSLEDGREVWRYGPLRTTLPPVLTSRDDRILVLDDVALHLIEEDRSRSDRLALPTPRTGPVAVLPGGHWLVPTTGGVELLVSSGANRYQWRPGPTPGQPGLVATDGDRVLVHRQDGRLDAFRWNGTAFALLWSADAGGPPACPPALAGERAAAADLSGRLVLVDAQAGKVVRRLARPSAAAALLVLGGRTLVADRSGILAAY